MKPTYVLTTFDKTYYDLFAKASIATWHSSLPSGWKLVSVDDDNSSDEFDIKLNCEEKHQWFDSIGEYPRHIQPTPKGHFKEWKRFSHKSWAQFTAYESLKSGFLIWMDSDVRWKSIPPIDLVELELQGHFSGYLGREQYVHKSKDGRHSHPETGIIFYDLDHPHAKKHFSHLRKIYSDKNLFKYPAWSDEYIYAELKKDNPAVYRSMTPTTSRFPLAISHLHQYFEHLMGPGKLHGFDRQGSMARRGLNL
jgi:hypothetical protein